MVDRWRAVSLLFEHFTVALVLESSHSEIIAGVLQLSTTSERKLAEKTTNGARDSK